MDSLAFLRATPSSRLQHRLLRRQTVLQHMKMRQTVLQHVKMRSVISQWCFLVVCCTLLLSYDRPSSHFVSSMKNIPIIPRVTPEKEIAGGTKRANHDEDSDDDSVSSYQSLGIIRTATMMGTDDKVPSPEVLLEENEVTTTDGVPVAESGCGRWICEHDKLGGFKPLYGSYYKPSGNNRPNIPKQCARCELKFVGNGQRAVPGKDVKVTNARCAYACQNALLYDSHSCSFAYCHACFNLRSVELSNRTITPRKKNRSRRYFE